MPLALSWFLFQPSIPRGRSMAAQGEPHHKCSLSSLLFHKHFLDSRHGINSFDMFLDVRTESVPLSLYPPSHTSSWSGLRVVFGFSLANLKKLYLCTFHRLQGRVLVCKLHRPSGGAWECQERPCTLLNMHTPLHPCVLQSASCAHSTAFPAQEAGSFSFSFCFQHSALLVGPVKSKLIS